MKEIDILKKSLRDFFTPYMLKVALIPLLITMFVLFLLFFTTASFTFSSLQDLALASQNESGVVVSENAPFYEVWFIYFLVFLFKYSITSWIAGFLFVTVGTIFVFHLSLILTLIIIGFLTPLIVKYLHKKDYSNLTLNPFGTLSNALFNFLKAFFMMILLYILLVPLYFIPLINIVAFYLPLYYFFHKMLNFDVASTILSKDEFDKIYKTDSFAFRFRTLGLYFLSTIPFITLFVAVFFVIYLSHAYFIKLEELKNEL